MNRISRSSYCVAFLGVANRANFQSPLVALSAAPVPERLSSSIISGAGEVDELQVELDLHD